MQVQLTEASISIFQSYDQECFHCGYTKLVEDFANGDVVCTVCGVVAEERSISDESEVRVFNDDPESYTKSRISGSYNPLMEYSLTQRTKLEKDVSICSEFIFTTIFQPKEYLWNGRKNIEEILLRLFSGDMNCAVKYRAQ